MYKLGNSDRNGHSEMNKKPLQTFHYINFTIDLTHWVKWGLVLDLLSLAYDLVGITPDIDCLQLDYLI